MLKVSVVIDEVNRWSKISILSYDFDKQQKMILETDQNGGKSCIAVLGGGEEFSLRGKG